MSKQSVSSTHCKKFVFVESV